MSCWKIASASVAGRQHTLQGRSCEDALCSVEEAGDTLLVALADGAGSAARAALGARICVQSALRWACLHGPSRLSAEEWPAAARAACAEVRRRLLATAKREGRPLGDYHATLQLIIASPRQWHALQVGDGFIAYSDGSDMQLVDAQQPQGYVNETRFVGMRQARPLCLSLERPPRFWACSSDGLSHLAIEQAAQRPHRGFFRPLRNFLKETASRAEANALLHSLLLGPKFRSRCHDDCSLLLAYRPPEQHEAPSLTGLPTIIPSSFFKPET